MPKKKTGTRGPGRPAQGKVRIQVTLPPRLKFWTDREARRRGITRGEVIEAALKAALKR